MKKGLRRGNSVNLVLWYVRKIALMKKGLRPDGVGVVASADQLERLP